MNRFEDPDYLEWAKQVKERDNYHCQLCSQGFQLHSHHLNGWNLFIDQRYDIDNGITLCRQCHDHFHLMFQKGGNTKYQFEQFRQIYKLFEKIIKKG